MRTTEDIINLKTMILTGAMDIKSLTKAELDALIDNEYETMDEDHFDDHFLSLCLSELDQFTDTTYIDQIDTTAIFNKVYNEWNNPRPLKKPPVPIVRKVPLRILVAAIALVVLFTFTASAFWNPFSAWIMEIRDLFGMTPGETIKNNSGELTADTQYMCFESIEDLENALGRHFDLLEPMTIEPTSIVYTQLNQSKLAILQFQSESESLTIKIYLENPPFQEPMDEESMFEIKTISNRKWYALQDTVQYVHFDDKYVYFFTADTHDNVIKFLEGELK